MAHTNDRIEEDVKNILHTRVAIADKLERLEQRVEQQIERSRMAAKDFVDHTAGVVEDMVDKTKDRLSPVHQFQRRPWVILGGAVLLGYIAALVEAKTRSSGVYPYYPKKAEGADVMPTNRSAQDEHEAGVYPFYPGKKPRNIRSRPVRPMMAIPFVQEIVDELIKEMHTVKGSIIDSGRTFLRDVSAQVIPSLFRSLRDRTLSGLSGTDHSASSRYSGR